MVNTVTTVRTKDHQVADVLIDKLQYRVCRVALVQ
jgi:hypothetical protein